eukprot:764298-Hanusia_phi.AAC.8
MFHGLSSLNVLVIDRFALSALPEGGFEPFEPTWLDRSGIQLRTFPGGLFDGLTNLICLFIDYRELRTLGIFNGLNSSYDLELHHNQLLCMLPNTFANHTRLPN